MGRECITEIYLHDTREPLPSPFQFVPFVRRELLRTIVAANYSKPYV